MLRHAASHVTSVKASRGWHRICCIHRKQNLCVQRQAAAGLVMAAHTRAVETAEDQQQQHGADDLLRMLADAHAHPQLDPANMKQVLHLQCCQVAAMSVSYDVDWDIMLQLHSIAGGNQHHMKAYATGQTYPSSPAARYRQQGVLLIESISQPASDSPAMHTTPWYQVVAAVAAAVSCHALKSTMDAECCLQ